MTVKIRDVPRFLCFTALMSSSLVMAAPASVSGGKTGGLLSSTSTSTPQTTLTGHGGGTGVQRIDPREAPPLDPKRDVTEQDCTKPVDLTKGNLKCK